MERKMQNQIDLYKQNAIGYSWSIFTQRLNQNQVKLEDALTILNQLLVKVDPNKERASNTIEMITTSIEKLYDKKEFIKTQEFNRSMLELQGMFDFIGLFENNSGGIRNAT